MCLRSAASGPQPRPTCVPLPPYPQQVESLFWSSSVDPMMYSATLGGLGACLPQPQSQHGRAPPCFAWDAQRHTLPVAAAFLTVTLPEAVGLGPKPPPEPRTLNSERTRGAPGALRGPPTYRTQNTVPSSPRIENQSMELPEPPRIRTPQHTEPRNPRAEKAVGCSPLLLTAAGHALQCCTSARGARAGAT